MTMPEAYCRVNRARGLELISPEDLLNACQALHTLPLPITCVTDALFLQCIFIFQSFDIRRLTVQ